MKPRVYIITGPTASGKTALALSLAERWHCDIVSADSRQLFRGIEIGTAAPTAAERQCVRHHLVGTLELGDYYSAAQYADDATAILQQTTATQGVGIVCGGSMMYIDALVNGLDDLPTISDEVRQSTLDFLHRHGPAATLARLKELDPEYYAQVDHQNLRRVVHAIEICTQAGVPYSTLRRRAPRQLPFRPIMVAIDMPRPVLFDRINRRVDMMIENGMLDEARRVYPLRHLNSLNTVGYKELFAYFDGEMDLHTAIERIKKNTRVYAKKQLTWLKRYPDIHWIKPTAE